MRAIIVTLIVFFLLVALCGIALLVGVWLPDIVFAPRSTLSYTNLPSGYTFRVVQYWNRADFYSTELHITAADGRQEMHTLDGDDSKSWKAPMSIDESNRIVVVTLGRGRLKKVSY